MQRFLVLVLLASLVACGSENLWEAAGRPANALAVVSSAPHHEENGIRVDVVIRLSFNKSLDPATAVASNISLVDERDQTAVSGLISLAENNTVLLFRPAAELALSGQYRLTLQQGLRCVYGNPLAGVWSLLFRTENPFSIRWSMPHWDGFCTDFGARERIEFNFSNPLDPARNYAQDISLRLGTNGTAVPGVWKVDFDNLRWTAEAPLAVGSVYELTVSRNLPDRNSRILTNTSDLKVYFKVASFPVLRDMMPRINDYGFPPWVPLHFRFSAPMQPTGWSVSDGVKTWASGKWAADGSELRIVPLASERLPYRDPGASVMHTLSLNGFKDIDGGMLDNMTLKTYSFQTLPRFVVPPSWSGNNPHGTRSDGFAASARDRQLYLVSVDGSQLRVFQYTEEYHQWGNEPEYGFNGFWSQLREYSFHTGPLTVLADGDGAFWGSRDATGIYRIESHNRSLAPPAVPLTNVILADMGRDGNGAPLLAVASSNLGATAYTVRVLRYANGRFTDLAPIPIGAVAPGSLAIGHDPSGVPLVAVAQVPYLLRYRLVSGVWQAAENFELVVAPTGRLRLLALAGKTFLNIPGVNVYEVTASGMTPAGSFGNKEDIGAFLGRLYGVSGSAQFLHHLNGNTVNAGFPHASGARVAYDNGANVQIATSARRLTVLYTKDDFTLKIHQHIAPPQ